MSILDKVNQTLHRFTGFKVTRFDPPENSDSYHCMHSFISNERWGTWSDRTINKYTELARDVEGDFAEIGVARGATFHRLAKIAHEQQKLAHAFDSFTGMAEPGEFDRKDGEPGAYHPGQFSVNGEDGFKECMDKHNIPREFYRTYAGYTPKCFELFPDEKLFSFVIIDVDHYQPTVDALNWVWPRLNKDGYLLLDDCAFGWDLECTRAIKEFLSSNRKFWIMEYYNIQLILKKEASLVCEC